MLKLWKKKKIMQKYALRFLITEHLRAYFSMSSLILCISQAIKNDSTPTLHYTFAPHCEALVFINLSHPVIDVIAGSRYSAKTVKMTLYKRTCLEGDPIVRDY